MIVAELKNNQQKKRVSQSSLYALGFNAIIKLRTI